MYDSALEVCVVQVLDKQLIRPEEDPKEELGHDKTSFLNALKILETTRKCMCQHDSKDSIIVMCCRFENELYRLRTQE
jgi:hypothetical protein